MTTKTLEASIEMPPFELSIEAPASVTAAQLLDILIDEVQLCTGKLESRLRDLGVTPDAWDSIDADIANGADLDIAVLG